MPYANLIVAQAASASIAAPFLVGLALPTDDATFGPYIYHIVAAVSAVIVFLAGVIASRFSKGIRTPTALTFALALAGALAGFYAARLLAIEQVQMTSGLEEILTLAPVSTAIAGYMLARGPAA